MEQQNEFNNQFGLFTTWIKHLRKSLALHMQV